MEGLLIRNENAMQTETTNPKCMTFEMLKIEISTFMN